MSSQLFSKESPTKSKKLENINNLNEIALAEKKKEKYLIVENSNKKQINTEEIDIKERKTIFDKFREPEEDLYFNNYAKQEKKNRDKKKGFSKLISKFKFKIKSLAYYLHNNYYFLIIINCFTIYALFADYFRIMLFNKYADIYFDIIVMFCIVIFSLEMIIFLLSEKNYFLSFYFFLDLITVVFLIFDINFIANEVFYSTQNFNLASKLILELGKIVRLIRLIRIFKLLKTLEQQNFKKSKKVGSSNSKQKKKESKITKKLKSLNIKRLIVLILIMLIVVPLFDGELWLSQNYIKLENKLAFSLPSFLDYPENIEENLKKLKSRFEEHNLELLWLSIDENSFYKKPQWDRVRKSETLLITKNFKYKNSEYAAKFSYSQRYQKIIQALLDLINTIFICLILLISIDNMNKTLSQLILNPLERMIQKIKKVSENPLNALKTNYTPEKGEEMNEAIVIEKAINKISELLILGFGQAGCTIITHFLFDPDKDFDQIIPGKRTFAIFGFCDIRNFTDATEILLEDIMVFVNEIAAIVHGSVDHFGGAANKNIGDAFLLVWKMLPPEKTKLDTYLNQDYSEMNDIEAIKKNPLNQQLAELSLLSFIDVIVQINTNPIILKYRENKKLCERMPGYKVKMGFGLHVGWAIEGAIGSRFKIDASYLSPNVNMASRLEAATKQFKKLILFTGDLYDMFITPNIINASRHIDTIKVQGSHFPVKLYTVDLNIKNLIPQKIEINKRKKKFSIPFGLKNNVKIKLGITNRYKSMEQEVEHINFLKTKVKTFEEDELVDKKIKEINFQKIFDFGNEKLKNFKTIFSFALDAYLVGKWDISKRFLEKAMKIIPDDGPTLVIYEYLESLNFNCPENWENCRQLIEK